VWVHHLKDGLSSLLLAFSLVFADHLENKRKSIKDQSA